MTSEEALARARSIIAKQGDISQDHVYGLAFATNDFPGVMRAIQALRPAGATPYNWKDWR